VNYKPVTGVWEVTMGCNMRCKHCGSSCTRPLPEELTTEEALALCDDIGELGLQWITLSGGEPLIRKDWPQLIRRLRERGVVPNLITNGWELDDEAIIAARDNGIGTVAISLDGLTEVHDYMRRPGSFERSTRALKRMTELGVTCGVITTVNQCNLALLPEMKEALIALGVRYWQLQIGLPMGNLAHHSDLVMDPADVDRVIDFTFDNVADERLAIYPADCLGYYSRKEMEVRRRLSGRPTPPMWQGCNAGKRSLGILHNGDILGCTSIRDRQFVEGNIRERRLREIWDSPDSFRWSREMNKANLDGHCRSCQFGDACLGGCPNTRLTMNRSIHSENQYCSYNLAVKRAEAMLAGVEDDAALFETARTLAAEGEMQMAGLTLERLLARQPDHQEALLFHGFVSFSLNNLDRCRDVNQRVLSTDPDNVYALKGLGLALHRMGDSGTGLGHLKAAAERSSPADMDAFHDLIVVCLEAGRRDEARAALQAACQRAPNFAAANPGLCQTVG